MNTTSNSVSTEILMRLDRIEDRLSKIESELNSCRKPLKDYVADLVRKEIKEEREVGWP